MSLAALLATTNRLIATNTSTCIKASNYNKALHLHRSIITARHPVRGHRYLTTLQNRSTFFLTTSSTAGSLYSSSNPLQSLPRTSAPLLSSRMAHTHALTGSLEHPVRQRPEEVNALIKTLGAGVSNSKAKGSWKSKKSTFEIAGTNITVNGWKFGDWDYKKFDLPIYARGLFTYRDTVSGNYEIVTRGYDKFFNIDEVHQTKWTWIEENTKAPYELTLKENGCIIFISGLPDGSLLVCSKHSTGARDIEASHAQMGERWAERHLAKVGKTKDDLAKTLRDLNATAVFELCDDEFEEHVIAYEKEKSGLYLHGINFNVPIFATCPADEVQKFAEEWGFIKTNYLQYETVAEMRKFLEEAAETGSWEGQDVEGFVIRCKARHGPNDPNWHDWFFKYKFEEPYLMYRGWRECTKAMLSGKTPQPKKHVKVTKEYLAFAKNYFQRNPKLKELYQRNHGIIALRDAFLQARGAKGSDLVKEDEGSTAIGGDTEPEKSIVLVPVATIGCGKTTVAAALTKLFGWGHVQNDNITAKSQKSVAFAKAISTELVSKPVCTADRNNHMLRERQSLIQDITGFRSDTAFVALQYVHYRKGENTTDYMNRIREATRNRVFSRGDKHQTIHADTMNPEFLINIMEGFLKRFQPVDTETSPDVRFETVIDLDVEADSRTNLETVVKELRSMYPKLITKLPTPEEYDAAIKYALNEYAPALKHTIGDNRNQNQNPTKRHPVQTAAPQQQQQQQQGTQNQSQQKKSKKSNTEYFSVQLPTEPILAALEATFKSLPDDQSNFYYRLKAKKRVQPAFHITLIHRAASNSRPAIWDQYQTLFNSKCKGDYNADMGSLRVRLEQVVWDGRTMAIKVRWANSDTDGESFPCVNKVAHVTVGTANGDIKPKEANVMLEKWVEEKEKGGERAVKECDLAEGGGGVELEGVVRAVQGRRK